MSISKSGFYIGSGHPSNVLPSVKNKSLNRTVSIGAPSMGQFIRLWRTFRTVDWDGIKENLEDFQEKFDFVPFF